MDKKENEMLSSSAAMPPGGMEGAAGPDSFDMNYFREARLFLGKDRATLTFYVDQEVASIHYDTQRDEIFYRGHNVKNMTMTQSQWHSLQKFAEYLSQDMRAEHLVQAYKHCLDHLMTDHDLPG